MDNKINLNFYGVNYQKAVGEKKEAEVKNEEKAAETPKKQVAANEILDAMALSGAQNIAFAGLNAINPKDYLDDASIARIQNSMLAFTGNVNNCLNAINAEFPNLSEAQKQELALQTALNTL